MDLIKVFGSDLLLVFCVSSLGGVDLQVHKPNRKVLLAKLLSK